MKNILLTILTIWLIFGCVKTNTMGRAYGSKTKFEFKAKAKKRQERYDYLTGCTRKWQLKVLSEEIDLQVITYTKAWRFDLMSYPAMLVGVTSQGDTLRVLQHRFVEEVNRGENVLVSPETNQALTDPLYLALINYPVTLANNKKEDYLYCQVKRTYIGIINQKTFR
jgi:hypothetical protein